MHDLCSSQLTVLLYNSTAVPFTDCIRLIPILQTVEWWERAATEAMDQGWDPTQALRLFMKADAAADALQNRMQQHMADSALSIGQHLHSSKGSASFSSQATSFR